VKNASSSEGSFEGNVASDNGSLRIVPKLHSGWPKLNEAALKFGKKIDIAAEQKERMIETGFVDVEDKCFRGNKTDELLGI
jgi:hypothetical protein